MGLPWRFISPSAGIVTLGRGTPLRQRTRAEGKLREAHIVSSAAPGTQDATRTNQVYAWCGCMRIRPCDGFGFRILIEWHQ